MGNSTAMMAENKINLQQIRTRSTAVINRLARDIQELAAALQIYDEARILALDSRLVDDFQALRDAETRLAMLIELAVHP
jgi:hypothetical protein